MSSKLYSDAFNKVSISPLFTQKSQPILRDGIFLNHSWEPIELKMDKEFWDCEYSNKHAMYKKYNILHSEKNSPHIRALERSGFNTIHWFSHGYLCSEHWYRLYKDISVVTNERKILYPWVCANRLVDKKRRYRIEFLNMLNLSHDGQYSLPDKDPQTGRSINEIYPHNRVDPKSFDAHENSSAWINLEQGHAMNSSFLHVVMETVIDRQHLTEKIFKPIVLQQPFVIVSGWGSLDYLKSYGFRTFGEFWNEGYDGIVNDQERMKAVAEIVNDVSCCTHKELEGLRRHMQKILQHNYRLFYDEFSSICWQELVSQLN